MFEKINLDNAKLAWQVTWKYALFGFLWIMFSDAILEMFIKDLDMFARIQTIKGWLYVLITSLILYSLVNQVLKKTTHRNVKSMVECDEYRGYFNNTNAGIIITDIDKKIIRVNETFMEMVGLAEDELKELKYKSIIHPEDAIVENQLIDQVKNGSIDRFNIDKRMTINGKKMWLREFMKVERNENGEILHCISLVVDITNLKEMTEKNKVGVNRLERLQEEDTKVIRRLEKDKERLQLSLVESERMASLGNLIAGFAHEINTPIGISLTTHSYLQKQFDEVNEAFKSQSLSKNQLASFIEELEEALTLMNKNLHRAADYVSSFKQNAVDQSNFNEREFNLKTVIDDCITSIKPFLKKADYNIEVTCPDNINLYTYPGAISHTISNLVLNAINHGFEGRQQGTIKVIVEEGDGSIHLTVSDDGKGIPEYAMNKIYEPFYTTKPNEGGTGLGLSIVHQLVLEKLEGSIECKSIDGEGTTFKIDFPFKTESK